MEQAKVCILCNEFDIKESVCYPALKRRKWYKPCPRPDMFRPVDQNTSNKRRVKP